VTSTDFHLTPENLRDYLLSVGLSDANDRIAIGELGGGVSNVVLLVEWVDDPTRRWVVKQSIGKLRVSDEWLSDRERIFREAESLAILRPLLGDGSVPRVIHVDRTNYLYVMTAAPRSSMVWKDSLLAGQSAPLLAQSAGTLLSQLIRVSSNEPRLQTVFGDRRVFEQLRIDPYYRQAASRNPDVAESIQNLIHDSWEIRTALVHGDYSPKNMLVSGTTIFLIDFEVVHWGDPAFDAGFLMSHLFLKAFHRPSLWRTYRDAALEFWKALRLGLEAGAFPAPEAMAVRHLGGLMLARVDGKSPVEYLKDARTKSRIRQAAKQILRDRPSTITAAAVIIQRQFGQDPG
jgi:5-methylthioribose kinase